MNKVAIFCVVGFLALYTMNYLEDVSIKRQQRVLESQEARENLRAFRAAELADAEAMIDIFNADTEWGTKLCGSRQDIFDRVLTIYAEEAWIQDNPIYFSGSIEDVRNHSDQLYEISASLGFGQVYGNPLLEALQPFCYISETLRLKLTAPKELIDPQLERIASLYRIYHSYGLVAKINNVSSEFYLDENGNRETAMIGQGSLISIMPLRIRSEPVPNMISEFPTNNTTTEVQPINTDSGTPLPRTVRGDF